MRNELDPPADALEQAEVVPSGAAMPTAVVEPSAAGERFLAQVSELLNSSLDYRATIQSVARLATGILAEYCIVHVHDAGEIRALGIAHADISREAGLRETLRLLPA